MSKKEQKEINGGTVCGFGCCVTSFKTNDGKIGHEIVCDGQPGSGTDGSSLPTWV
ncbi:hypothetical protein G1K66_11465 [Tenacibaculum finnmarkense]|uniref:hypothetical protein n=1 Tax=Tenacibaculum finnmarkense TaxID=2781243 RepID=UPI001EFA9A4D|nr:hypothetical protein [Tenacibaculum finnmarkense]MCG8813871.1 hypothetical protein [Tenacibaculum finnmarkense]